MCDGIPGDDPEIIDVMDCEHADYQTPLCPRCQKRLVPGQALRSTVVGTPDFPGDEAPITLSPGGPGRLTTVLKCPDCGYSRSV